MPAVGMPRSDANTVMHRLLVDKCGLDGVRVIHGTETLDRGHVMPIRFRHRRYVRAARFSVQKHGAGATLREPQPNFGPFNLMSSCNTYNSGVSGSTSIE